MTTETTEHASDATQVDPILAGLVRIIEAPKTLITGMPVTIMVDGLVISGVLVKRSKFVEEHLRLLAEGIARGIMAPGAIKFEPPLGPEREQEVKEKLEPMVKGIVEEASASIKESIKESMGTEDEGSSRYLHLANARIIGPGGMKRDTAAMWSVRIDRVSAWTIGEQS